MSTIITLTIASSEDAGKSRQMVVAEDFETVFNRVFPPQAESSPLEARNNMLFSTVDGRSVYINRGLVGMVEEGFDD